MTYRGKKAFSAPETQAIRDFVKSRVVNGRQQIRVHITLHTNGELILWPYGHTKTNIPADMSKDDHYAFVALGKRMAQRNGYTAKQSSDLYITDGDEIDWMYGRYRIFSFTWELYPTEHYTNRDFYPADEKIAAQVARNRSALLYSIDKADCPYSPIYKSQALCGPLMDDFEINRGWVRDPDGTDTASGGLWQIGDPKMVTADGVKQLGIPTSGRYAPRHGPGRRFGLERRRRRRRHDHDPLRPGGPAGHGRRPHVPVLPGPSLELERRGLVPGLGRGQGRDTDARP